MNWVIQYYNPRLQDEVLGLHTFIKKSQKIPEKELKIAFSRLKEIKNES